MRSAIILLLAFIVGCKDKAPVKAKEPPFNSDALGLRSYKAIHYGAEKDTIINDTLYLTAPSLLDESSATKAYQFEAPHGWCFSYGTMHGDTPFVTVMHGVTLVSYKKGDSVWHVMDSLLWKRFLDTIEVIRRGKKNVPRARKFVSPPIYNEWEVTVDPVSDTSPFGGDGLLSFDTTGIRIYIRDTFRKENYWLESGTKYSGGPGWISHRHPLIKDSIHLYALPTDKTKPKKGSLR